MNSLVYRSSDTNELRISLFRAEYEGGYVDFVISATDAQARHLAEQILQLLEANPGTVSPACPGSDRCGTPPPVPVAASDIHQHAMHGDIPDKEPVRFMSAASDTPLVSIGQGDSERHIMEEDV